MEGSDECISFGLGSDGRQMGGDFEKKVKQGWGVAILSGAYRWGEHTFPFAKNSPGLNLCPCVILQRAFFHSQKGPRLHDK